ncbi:guanylate cyclase activator 2B-like [Sphaeramia orbicularis]|uniref:guanylate cyclase activator 2B-like n=1 Tax=Sphaeramia orbicularis TaxID=375764 RepID=UPI00117FF7A4|nr:guanylate cyclase activator 2B-like [Sphaeramia orbicularis]
MKTAVCIFLVALLQLSSSVIVTEGDYNFSLEAVKELGTLISEDDASAVHELQRLEAKVAAVCFHPALPQVFKPLCQRRDAGTALARLAFVAVRSDACEICESVACTGC